VTDSVGIIGAGRLGQAMARLRDDARAKAEVVALFQDAGFAAIDLGDLATGGAMQQIHQPLAGVNLIRL
jgi:predicted dinucleotide-binding enzyme